MTRRPLTPMEVSMVLGVVLLIVLCCLGTMALSLAAPDPAPMVQVWPTPS